MCAWMACVRYGLWGTGIVFEKGEGVVVRAYMLGLFLRLCKWWPPTVDLPLLLCAAQNNAQTIHAIHKEKYNTMTVVDDPRSCLMNHVIAPHTLRPAASGSFYQGALAISPTVQASLFVLMHEAGMCSCANIRLSTHLPRASLEVANVAFDTSTGIRED
ncbi:uncharacterized protein LAESUDRAFT_715661 [Laetiporus sulphureus 93-53]|uniref:Uncharacterized protein n=1 Tax=Laetiporus sulphureus 93-53 TaxID=1314785 RepID=A0A165D9G7_9APHY|nr:uncharacterized protein LAESUDRAFT_715661 [Laetiporus sulphureus 93-53]KZT04382.1 hypothetical protein LAESUDRAFT_715661 [Laetiporus sulphureus 93-53]